MIPVSNTLVAPSDVCRPLVDLKHRSAVKYILVIERRFKLILLKEFCLSVVRAGRTNLDYVQFGPDTRVACSIPPGPQFFPVFFLSFLSHSVPSGHGLEKKHPSIMGLQDMLNNYVINIELSNKKSGLRIILSIT